MDIRYRELEVLIILNNGNWPKALEIFCKDKYSKDPPPNFAEENRDTPFDKIVEKLDLLLN